MRHLWLLFFTLAYLKASSAGELYFSGNCVTCHHPTKTISAPSVVEFKKRYSNAFSDKKEFVNYMSKWVLKPTEKGSLMHDAIQKHGLMPELGFDEDTLREIATYIYDTDFTKKGELDNLFPKKSLSNRPLH